MTMPVWKGLIWELKRATKLRDIPFVLFWQLLVFPYRFNRVITRIVVGKEYRNKRFIRSFHEYVWSICRNFHIPPKVAYRIESTRFQDPYSHEAEVSRVLVETSGKLFVDVGANIGRYTILLAPRYQQVIAIEPEPRNMNALKRNVQEAKLTNVTFIQCAVSDTNGIIELFLGPHAGAHTVISSYERSIKVSATTLDNLLSDRESIELIKVDVEGAEWKVLGGAKRIIGKIRSWVIELHNLKRRNKLESLMRSFGYEYRWLDRNHIYAWREQGA